jgi:hypothetical protein
MRFARSTAVVCLVVAPFFQALPISAQQKSEAPPAPIPAEILATKRIFIGNAGGEDSVTFTKGTDQTLFSGGANRAYNEFYQAMKKWGRYELASLPDNAGLLFEIQFTMVPYDRTAVNGEGLGSQTFDPRFRLVIRDPKTSAILWVFIEHTEWAILKGNRDKNFEDALGRLVADVQQLVAAPAAGSR